MFQKNFLSFASIGALLLLLPCWLTANPASGSSVTRDGRSVEPVVIGTGTEETMNAPVTPWYGYSFSQTLYFQSEINVSQKVINKIGYQYSGTDPNLELEIEVWMSHTELSSLANTVQLSGHQKVYDGPWFLHAGEEFSEIEINP